MKTNKKLYFVPETDIFLLKGERLMSGIETSGGEVVWDPNAQIGNDGNLGGFGNLGN